VALNDVLPLNAARSDATANLNFWGTLWTCSYSLMHKCTF